jgi:ankyrin repeat protein
VIHTYGGKLLSEFAGTANAAGVAQLLDLGVPITAKYDGDGYFGIAGNSTALHVAAWRAWHNVVQLLIERGAPVNIKDGIGRTPLMLSVSACVNSYWSYRRNTKSIELLLQAGAAKEGITIPTGYE